MKPKYLISEHRLEFIFPPLKRKQFLRCFAIRSFSLVIHGQCVLFHLMMLDCVSLWLVDMLWACCDQTLSYVIWRWMRKRKSTIAFCTQCEQISHWRYNNDVASSFHAIAKLNLLLMITLPPTCHFRTSSTTCRWNKQPFTTICSLLNWIFVGSRTEADKLLLSLSSTLYNTDCIKNESHRCCKWLPFHFKCISYLKSFPGYNKILIILLSLSLS